MGADNIREIHTTLLSNSFGLRVKRKKIILHSWSLPGMGLGLGLRLEKLNVILHQSLPQNPMEIEPMEELVP